MANKFKATPPTANGWYQVQWGNEEYNGYDTVWVAGLLEEDDTPTGEFAYSWPGDNDTAYLINPNDTQSRWRRVDAPKLKNIA